MSSIMEVAPFPNRYARLQKCAYFAYCVWENIVDFHFYRLSMKAKSNIDLFEPRDAKGEPLSRSEWLRILFSN